MAFAPSHAAPDAKIQHLYAVLEGLATNCASQMICAQFRAARGLDTAPRPAGSGLAAVLKALALFRRDFERRRAHVHNGGRFSAAVVLNQDDATLQEVMSSTGLADDELSRLIVDAQSLLDGLVTESGPCPATPVNADAAIVDADAVPHASAARNAFGVVRHAALADFGAVQHPTDHDTLEGYACVTATPIVEGCPAYGPWHRLLRNNSVRRGREAPCDCGHGNMRWFSTKERDELECTGGHIAQRDELECRASKRPKTAEPNPGVLALPDGTCVRWCEHSDEVSVVHARPEILPPLLDALAGVWEEVMRRIDPTCLVDVQVAVAFFSFRLLSANPWRRGSASIIEWLAAAMFKGLHLVGSSWLPSMPWHLPPRRKFAGSFDFVAFLTPRPHLFAELLIKSTSLADGPAQPLSDVDGSGADVEMAVEQVERCWEGGVQSELAVPLKFRQLFKFC